VTGKILHDSPMTDTLWCRFMDTLLKTQTGTWVVLIYATHALALFPLAHLMGLDWRGMTLPFLILVLGMGGGLALRWSCRGRTARNWRAGFPALLYAGFIFSLSEKSFEGVSVPVDTNLFHPVEYMLLAIFLCCVWPPHGQRSTALRRSLIPVLVCGSLFALSDEFHQAFVPGRVPSLEDLCFDLWGILVGWGLCRLLSIFREQLRRYLDGTCVKPVAE
jgi:hypothetical protein